MNSKEQKLLNRKKWDKKYRRTHKEEICKKEKEWRDNHKEQEKKRTIVRHLEHPNYWKEYFRKLKKWAVDKLGRKCSECGLESEFDCVYDFHHLGEDSWSHKENPTNMRIKELIKWKKADSIPIDCKLICANCHRIKTQLNN
jgi:hypothetical protein